MIKIEIGQTVRLTDSAYAWFKRSGIDEREGVITDCIRNLGGNIVSFTIRFSNGDEYNFVPYQIEA